MDRDPEEDLPDQSRAQELGRRFERFIIGAVANKFEVSPENLTLLHDFSTEFPNDPNHVYFRVLDRKANIMYGVVATLQPDGGLIDYKCDRIAL